MAAEFDLDDIKRPYAWRGEFIEEGLRGCAPGSRLRLHEPARPITVDGLWAAMPIKQFRDGQRARGAPALGPGLG